MVIVIWLLIASSIVFALPNSGYTQFKDYPAKNAYTGKSATLKLNNDTAREYRTRLKDALANNEAVFAGEYAIASWGCGASCVVYTFVNKRTGQVVEDGFGGEMGEQIDSFRLNSRLIVTHGADYDDDFNEVGYFANFYEFKNDKFNLIKRIPIDKPEDE